MGARAAKWALLVLAAAAAVEAAFAEELYWDCDARPLCPSGTNDDACVTDIGCPDGYVREEHAAACGCCSGCFRPAILEDEFCNETMPCPYGYYCDGDEGMDRFCMEGECTFALERAIRENNQWKPTCNRDGSYSAVQCKGQIGSDGRCFCWSPDGKRLYGEATWGSDSEKMDCACSLAALKKKENEAPRCTEDGSFESLQCAAGVCWCAHHRTGKPLGRAVPLYAMSSLFCYNVDDVGVQYRRVCDSITEARAELERVYNAHGGTTSGLPNVKCDLNGGYGAVQTRLSGTESYCSRQDKTQIEAFFQNTDPTRPMDCNCARDTDAFQTKLACYSHGNYKARISTDGYTVSCIDSDGYFSHTLKDITKDCPNEIK